MFELVLASSGLVLLMLRMRGCQSPPVNSLLGGEPSSRTPLFKTVSVIVPARNEALVIGPLLESLVNLQLPLQGLETGPEKAGGAPHLEIIVVDDESQDGTGEIVAGFAEKFGKHPNTSIQLLRGKPRPTDYLKPWNGKQWACHQGAEAATGDFLLFTDADTVHRTGSLASAVNHMIEFNLGLLSALPFHRSETWWERMLGPFHVWLLAMTSPYSAPQPKRLYAIGQYLLFRRQTYLACGGHALVRNCLVEDIPLAQRVVSLATGQLQEAQLPGTHSAALPYGVYTDTSLYEVRMYASFGDFLRGWRRNFRAGFDLTSPWLGVDAFLFIAAVTGAGHAFFAPGPAIVAFTTMIYLIWLQSKLGKFSFWGPLFFPFSLGVFCLVSLAALGDKVLKRQQKWKGRSFDPRALKAN